MMNFKIFLTFKFVVIGIDNFKVFLSNSSGWLIFVHSENKYKNIAKLIHTDFKVSFSLFSSNTISYKTIHCTLKVLIDFCPAKSVYLFLTCSFVYKNLWYSTWNYYGISDLGLTISHFDFLSLYLDMFDQNWSFVHKKCRFLSNIFDYWIINSKCGKVKPRSDIP